MEVCDVDPTLNDIFFSGQLDKFENCTNKARFHIASPSQQIAVAFIFSAFGVTGIAVNIVSILIILRGKNTSKATKGTKIQLLNKTVADLLVAVICTPMTITRDLYLEWPKNYTALCKISPFVAQSTLESSVAWTTIISVERFMAVYFPLRMMRYRKKHKRMAAIIVWVLLAATNIEYLVYNQVLEISSRNDGNQTIRLCLNTVPLASTNKALYDVLEGAPYLIFTIIIITMYTLIGIKLKLRQRQKHLGQNDHSRNTEKVLGMLAADAVVNLVTLTLTYITYMSMHADSVFDRLTPHQNFITHEIFNSVEITNSFTTPLIYSAFNKGYRKDAKKLLQAPLLALSRSLQPNGGLNTSTRTTNRSAQKVMTNKLISNESSTL